jgi:hypothetical protein
MLNRVLRPHFFLPHFGSPPWFASANVGGAARLAGVFRGSFGALALHLSVHRCFEKFAKLLARSH